MKIFNENDGLYHKIKLLWVTVIIFCIFLKVLYNKLYYIYYNSLHKQVYFIL